MSAGSVCMHDYEDRGRTYFTGVERFMVCAKCGDTKLESEISDVETLEHDIQCSECGKTILAGVVHTADHTKHTRYHLDCEDPTNADV